MGTTRPFRVEFFDVFHLATGQSYSAMNATTRELAPLRDALSEELQNQPGDILEVSPPDAGMHLIAWLPEGFDDRTLSETLWKAGIDVLPLSMYCLKPHSCGGLMLGFANTAVQDLVPKVERLAKRLYEK